MRLDQRVKGVSITGLSRRARGRLISQFAGPHPLIPCYFDDRPAEIHQAVDFNR